MTPIAQTASYVYFVLMKKTSGLLGEIKRSLNQKDLDTLILFITNACNLRCKFCCYAGNLNQARDIPFDNMLKLSRTMPPFRSLLLSGGEPFIRPRLEEIMLAFARNNGVSSIAVPTNGWYTDRIVSSCRAFLDQERNTMLSVGFSVDGLAPRHNAIRGLPETFDNLCRTLDALTPLCAQYSNLRLRVHSVVTPENACEMRETIDFFHQRFDLEEHSLEIVRDLKWKGVRYDTPEQLALADSFTGIARYAYDLYYKSGKRIRPKVGHLNAGLANLLTYAHCLANVSVKRRRIRGRLWPFPCTAGRKIMVVDGPGTLRACELRDPVLNLGDYDFDMQRALATGLMEREVAQLRKDRCDCIHGCFVGSGLQHSPWAILTRILPQAVRYFARPVTSACPAPASSGRTPHPRQTGGSTPGR